MRIRNEPTSFNPNNTRKIGMKYEATPNHLLINVYAVKAPNAPQMFFAPLFWAISSL